MTLQSDVTAKAWLRCFPQLENACGNDLNSVKLMVYFHRFCNRQSMSKTISFTIYRRYKYDDIITDLSVGALPEWLNEDAGLRVNNTCLTEKTCKCRGQEE